MEELNLKKIPGILYFIILKGSSNLEDKKIEIFSSDSRFINDPKIRSILDEHANAFKNAGFIEDVSVALKSFENDDELIENVCMHSERIAIAMMSDLFKDDTLYLYKNLRVCKNCHIFSKFISSYLKKKIVVRDANRFHSFENGKCSCNDYW